MFGLERKRTRKRARVLSSAGDRLQQECGDKEEPWHM
jgi:hypothetical protein